MNFKNIVIAGGGVLGSQIAFQSAYCGFDVTLWLRSESSITRTQPKLDAVKEKYIETINSMAENENNWAYGIADKENFNKIECLKKVETAYNSIKIELDMAKAVKDADLVIESMSEDVDAKLGVYNKLSTLLPEKTVIVTNSSTFLPSKFAESTGRPEKYLALHFANLIWKNNTAEIMAHDKTDMKYFDQVMEFAEAIRMIPLPVRKEKAGYLLNSMLIPLLVSAMDLYANEISDPKSIDTAWTVGTGAPLGPFQILDIIGMKTTYNIISTKVDIPPELSPFNYRKIAEILKNYIDEGKLGISSGEGFYQYK